MVDETIRKYVEDVLEEIPESRASDKILIFEVLRRMGFHIEVKEPISELPSFESIRRWRQHIQSPKGENKLYPSEEVEKAREKHRQDFRETFRSKKGGYTSEGMYVNGYMMD